MWNCKNCGLDGPKSEFNRGGVVECPRCNSMSVGPMEMWENDDVQFARLLAEIKAVRLTSEQTRSLCESMDLTPDLLCEILDRAEEKWSKYLAEFLAKRQV